MCFFLFFFFFFNDTATTEIYTLSLHDALPIWLNAATGITTPFHAISFAHEEFGVRNNEIATQIVRALHDYQIGRAHV